MGVILRLANHMSLHQSFKQSNQNQKETCLAAVPSTADLSYAYNQALKSRRKPIVLSWKSPGNPTTFYLTVTCNDSNSELPDWLLQKCDEGALRRDIWMHSSPDTTLIRELVLAEEQSSASSNLPVPDIPQIDLSAAQGASSFAGAWGTTHASPPPQPAQGGWAPNTPPPRVMNLPPLESPVAGGGLLRAPQQVVIAPEQKPQNATALDSGQYPAKPMHAQPLDISGQHRACPPQAPNPQLDVSGQYDSRKMAVSARPLPPPAELDRSLVDEVMRSLSNLETGLLTHQAFLFFLVREFTQFKATQLPFSIIIAEFFINTPTNGIVSLPPPYRRLAAQSFFASLRPLDMAAHYEQNDFALLLPNSPRADALSVAATIVQAAQKAAMPPEMSASMLMPYLGISTYPTDSNHPGIFLAAAVQAKNEARQTGKAIVVFGT